MTDICFFHDLFFRRRVASIERRLTALRTADLYKEVQQSWDAHLGTLCVGLSWDLLDRESLATVAACIGERGWGLWLVIESLHAGPSQATASWLASATCWRKTTGIAAAACPTWFSGVWLVSGGGGREHDTCQLPPPSFSGPKKQCRFLEVKSPNDRLADKQRIWLHVLHTLGADVGVCNVATSGARNVGAKRGADSGRASRAGAEADRDSPGREDDGAAAAARRQEDDDGVFDFEESESVKKTARRAASEE